MSMLSKMKGLFSKKTSDDNSHRLRKIIGFTLLAVGNVAAVSVATIAWFGINNRESRIDMVSGDLDVEINKVTAYKYVYPYYKNSTEYIDYNTDGVVKKYVIEDHVLQYNSTDVDDISITSDNATITLGSLDPENHGSYTTNQNQAGPANICIPTGVYKPEFTYYLIGDDKFCAVDDSWAIKDAYAFALKAEVAADRHAILNNVVVSAGSSFRLLKAEEDVVEGNTVYYYDYFPLSSIAESSSPFRLVDDNSDGVYDRILCLRSGIYNFTISPNQLFVELNTRDGGSKKDISVITNNSMDPTKVTIDYAGGQNINKTNPAAPNYYPTVESYLATAIYNQYTTVVLDVELNFKNANPVEASLKIERTNIRNSDYSIYHFSNKYSDTTHNLNGYIDDSHINPLRASDFYNFYAVFTKTPYTDVNDTEDGDPSDDLWLNLHRVGDANSQKFLNTGTYNDLTQYDKELSCTLNLKDNVNDSIIIPGIDPDGLQQNIYHCYIAIEYDYEHCSYFLNKNRLGKTYKLDRDFGFHFFGTQVTEE